MSAIEGQFLHPAIPHQKRLVTLPKKPHAAPQPELPYQQTEVYRFEQLRPSLATDLATKAGSNRPWDELAEG